MRWMMTWLLMVACLSAQTAYHFDKTSGSDSNDGLTPATAKQNLSWFNTNQAAGDTALLKGGETFTGQLLITAPGVTITAYRSDLGRPLIQPTTASQRAIEVRASYVTVSHVSVDGNANDGLYLDAPSNPTSVDYFVAYNVLADQSGNAGFDMDPVSNGLFANASVFINCTATDNADDGFDSRGTGRSYYEDCLSSGHNAAGNSQGYSSHGSNAMFIRGCISTDNTDGASQTADDLPETLTESWFYNNGDDGYQCSGNDGSTYVFSNNVFVSGAVGGSITNNSGCIRWNNGSVAIDNNVFVNNRPLNGGNRHWNIDLTPSGSGLTVTMNNNLFLLDDAASSTNSGHLLYNHSSYAMTSFFGNVFEDKFSTPFRNGASTLQNFADFLAETQGEYAGAAALYVTEANIPLTDTATLDVDPAGAVPTVATGSQTDLIGGGTKNDTSPVLDYNGYTRNLRLAWGVGAYDPNAKAPQSPDPEVISGVAELDFSSSTQTWATAAGTGSRYMSFLQMGTIPTNGDMRYGDSGSAKRGAQWVQFSCGDSGTLLLGAATGRGDPSRPVQGQSVTGVVSMSFPGTYYIKTQGTPITAIEFMASGASLNGLAITAKSFE